MTEALYARSARAVDVACIHAVDRLGEEDRQQLVEELASLVRGVAGEVRVVEGLEVRLEREDLDLDRKEVRDVRRRVVREDVHDLLEDEEPGRRLGIEARPVPLAPQGVDPVAPP